MKNIYLIPLVFILFSCNSMKKSNESKSVQTDLYTVLLSSDYQGRDKESSVVIDNQEDLSAIFKSVGSTEKPVVDFTKSQVVALFLGTRNSGGYSILIDRVEEEGDKLVIYKKVSSPKEGSMVTMALTNPFVIAEIHSLKELNFK